MADDGAGWGRALGKSEGVRNIFNSEAENSEKQILEAVFSVLIHPRHFHFTAGCLSICPSARLCSSVTVGGALTTEDKGRKRNLPDFDRGWWEKL